MRTGVIQPLKKRESLCCWNNYIACIQMFKYIHSNAKQKNIRVLSFRRRLRFEQNKIYETGVEHT